jgi:hypothetical protein
MHEMIPPERHRPRSFEPIPELAPVTTATRGEVSLTAIGTPHKVKRLKTASAPAAGVGVAGATVRAPPGSLLSRGGAQGKRWYSRESKTSSAVPAMYTGPHSPCVEARQTANSPGVSHGPLLGRPRGFLLAPTGVRRRVVPVPAAVASHHVDTAPAAGR